MGALWQIHRSLARLKGGRCRQQLGKHECFRHANSFSIQVELRYTVLAQRAHRDATKVGEQAVLQHYLCQMLSSFSHNAILVDTVQPQDVLERSRMCDIAAKCEIA